ncbi:hypothetical protein [Candidatus Accumulibacter sp. ACC003]|nr:hypothetical protein [Candidatus Accumulibacter sp. ACC003]
MITALLNAYIAATWFAVPIASVVAFSGALAFDPDAPTRDLLRCLP